VISSYLQIEKVCDEKLSIKQKASAMQFSYVYIGFQIFRKFYEKTSRIQSYNTTLPKYSGISLQQKHMQIIYMMNKKDKLII
jgi:hypothetical protein